MMNRSAQVVWTILVSLLLGACSSVEIHADYEPGTDFSQFHTYAWLPDEPGTGSDVRAGNPLVSERVTKAIEAKLAAMGYEQVDSQPDLQVGFSISVRHGIDIHSEPIYYGRYGMYGHPGGYGYGFGYGFGYTGSIQTYDYREGTLLIDLVDPGANALVWRGTGVSRLRDNQSPQESTARINEIVGKVLRQFPPK